MKLWLQLEAARQTLPPMIRGYSSSKVTSSAAAQVEIKKALRNLERAIELDPRTFHATADWA